MHFMCNVACLREGHPAALLIRALQPLEGQAAMREHRPGFARERDLCNGPGKLCQALAIDRALNGVDLVRDPRLRLLQAPTAARADKEGTMGAIARSARIGVDSCGDWAEAPLRWFVMDSEFVSPGRPSRNPNDTRSTRSAKPLAGQHSSGRMKPN